MTVRVYVAKSNKKENNDEMEDDDSNNSTKIRSSKPGTGSSFRQKKENY